jgi:O-antigen/teichoic acid export membrane protein
MNNIRTYSNIYLVIALIALLSFALTFIHPGPFYVSFRIPDPRTLLEIVLGIALITTIILIGKGKFKKPTKIALISVVVSIVLYFILRLIHIPGEVLWGFLVLTLVIIVWATISVIVYKRK